MVLVWDTHGGTAARYLQVSPEEVQIGVRPARDRLGRVQGEVFIYDNVPGGAGYARAIQDSLGQITELALEMGRNCPNANCSGACYHCLLGYSVDDQDLYTIVITTYIPPRQVGDGPWTPWYADYYHR